MSARQEHLDLLRKALAFDDLSVLSRTAFEGFVDDLTAETPPKYATLSEKKLAWVTREVEAREPVYQNLFSTGKVPRGNEVPVPKALQYLPKRPPGRTGSL